MSSEAVASRITTVGGYLVSRLSDVTAPASSSGEDVNMQLLIWVVDPAINTLKVLNMWHLNVNLRKRPGGNLGWDTNVLPLP